MLVPPVLHDIRISERAGAAVESGNLWVFSNEIQEKMSTYKKGEWARFRSKRGFAGLGYINPHSLIAGRIVSRQKDQNIEMALKNGIEQAFLRRVDFEPKNSTRLVFSESDFLPGLVLDYFSGVLVLQSNTAGMDSVLPFLELELPALFQSAFKTSITGFVVRADSGIRRLEGVDDFSRVIVGDENSLRDSVFSSDELMYSIDFLSGQKTGFFLDQRDNRRFFSRTLSNKNKARLLDLFCYSGGWGLAGLKAGAAHVTFVDESAGALALVDKGLTINGFSKGSARLAESNAFEFLESDVDLYDIVVADPPAFVKSKKTLPQAKKAYEKLFRLAWRRVKPNGILYASSCSYHLADEEFFDILKSVVSKEKNQAHVIYRGGQASDHPILLSMPETKYLKCAGLKKMTAC